MKNWKMIVGISITLLMALSMAVSACPTWCSPCKDEYFGGFVAQGETITLTAPAGYAYQWTKYDASGSGTVDGTAQTCTIKIPDAATTGQEFGAVVSLTAAHTEGNGNPTCIATECIYVTVNRFTLPSLDDYCIAGALPANADKFMMTMPPGEGFTYTWSGTGLNGNALSSPMEPIVLGALNAQTGTYPMTAGAYSATLTIKHGVRTALVYTDGFNVFALPSGLITMPS
jgi:hypothetical protein